LTLNIGHCRYKTTLKNTGGKTCILPSQGKQKAVGSKEQHQSQIFSGFPSGAE